MNRIARMVLVLCAALVVSTVANAQLFRAYLSVSGSDANPCTLAAPCRLLPAALNAVTSGGEVWMLDSANYNTAPVTVGKSVSILAVPGAVGSVVATAGPALSITASSLTVALRNLVIVPLPGAASTNGIELSGASTLTIENSLLANLSGGAAVNMGAGTVNILGSTIRDSAFAVLATGGHLAVTGSKLVANTTGIWAHALSATVITGAVSDTFFTANGEQVIASADVAGAAAQIFLTRDTIENGTTGVECTSNAAGAAALITLNATTIVHNSNFGYFQSGAAAFITSLGNNQIMNNGGSAGSLTPASLQ